MNCRLANHKPRDASPEYSLMHSKHVTTTAQDMLDALKFTSPLPPLAITLSKAMPNPLPDSSAAQDTLLPNAPSAAPAASEGWKTVEGKATQKKKKKAMEMTTLATTTSKTPTMKNGGRGKTTHQPKWTTPSVKKTWAEVIKSRGINVQIVLGNGNLGLTTTPMTKRRGERGGGVAWRLKRKEADGERGEEQWGRAGPGIPSGKEAENTSGGVERGEGSGVGSGPVVI
jgi:hypothetical protein